MDTKNFLNSVLPVMTEEEQIKVVNEIVNPLEIAATAAEDPIEKALKASYEANKNAIGVYKDKMLCFVIPGTFAGDVFLANGNVNDVSGHRLEGYTADDCINYNLYKHNVTHATYEDVKRLLPKACEKFTLWFMNGFKFKDPFRICPDF